MQNTPDDYTKQVAEELAALIDSGSRDEERKLALLKQLKQAPLRKQPAPVQEEDRIGIWQPYVKEGQVVYKREASRSGEWHLWADVHEIPAKGKRSRVLLLGESAARGFLYDPCYNVAKELQAVAGKMGLPHDVEIIDLARTSMLMDDLAALVRSCAALAPDCVVIFAGNNWIFNALHAESNYEELLRLYKDQWMHGLKQMVDEQMNRMVMAFLENVKTFLLKKNIPVVFVIPAFNLGDWRSTEMEQLVPCAPDGRTAGWLKEKERAEAALVSNNQQVLEAAAKMMIALDPSNPRGYELLAAFYTNCRKWELAKKYLSMARDTIVYKRCANSMPRCIEVIRDTLLAAAPASGILVVDLQHVFDNEYPDSIPGRELFLDNCHLTVKGIKLAMKHTAAVLHQTLTGLPLQPAGVPESGLYPDNQVSAIAHFSAAIYNKHYGQSPAIIRYHCNKAVALSPVVQQPMMQYIDFSTRYASSLFCQAFEEIIAEGYMRQYEGGFALCHPRKGKLLDDVLADAIVVALDAKGVHLAESHSRLRISEHAVDIRKRNLLESCYSRSSYQTFFIDSDAICHQERLPESIFRFVVTGNKPVFLDMILRVPAITAPGAKVVISVNDIPTPLAVHEASDRWTHFSFQIDAHLLNKGINKLAVTWPGIVAAGMAQAASAATEAAFLKALYPVTGEIWRLSVGVTSCRSCVTGKRHCLCETR